MTAEKKISIVFAMNFFSWKALLDCKEKAFFRSLCRVFSGNNMRCEAQASSFIITGPLQIKIWPNHHLHHQHHPSFQYALGKEYREKNGSREKISFPRRLFPCNWVVVVVGFISCKDLLLHHNYYFGAITRQFFGRKTFLISLSKANSGWSIGKIKGSSYVMKWNTLQK